MKRNTDDNYKIITGGFMKYRVLRLDVKADTMQNDLEHFLNEVDGEVLAVIPNVSPTFQLMGATSKVDFLLIVEKVT
jgi:hypothetical protein